MTDEQRRLQTLIDRLRKNLKELPHEEASDKLRAKWEQELLKAKWDLQIAPT